MSAPGARRAALPGIGLWLLAAVLGPVAMSSLAGSAAAASPAPELTVVSTARYDVQPSHRRVRVTVDLRATNHHSDTVIRSYFFSDVVLGFLPNASGFTVAAPAGSKVHPTVRVTSRTSDRVLVSVGFGTKLRSGKTVGVRLTFDLVDHGRAPDRAVRVGSAVATFPVWAVGTTGTPGSRVSVTVPAGYRIEVLGGPLAGPSTGPGGTKAYVSASLSAPGAFAAYILADRPGAYRGTPVNVTVGGAPYSVVVRSWQDDKTFGTRVAGILRKALPAIGTLVGAPPVAHGPGGTPLAVEEAVTRSAGGYAALFDGGTARISVAYDAGPAVVLHEAAHAWFNGSLVADRWAAEGFASYYARRVAGTLKIAIGTLPLTKALLAKRIPLNAWASDGTPDPVVDGYGIAASSALAKLIADRVGQAGLGAVWRAIEAGEMADQPANGGGAAEVDPAGASAPDWRALLDLIDTRTGKDVTDLWRTWVVRPDEAALLDRRATVRADYRSLVTEAGAWAVPAAIRVALDRWRFDEAADLIAKSRAVLAGRSALDAAAAAIGVRLPPKLRTAFEGDVGPAAAATELATEEAAVDRLAADIAIRPAEPGLVERIGLMGEDPDGEIAAARAAFASGDLTGGVRLADGAATTWVGALDVGRGRLAGAAGILTLFAALVLLVTASRDRRSRARWSYRAGQVIRSMGPGPRPGPRPVREVGPRSGAAAVTTGVQVTTRNVSHVSAAQTPMAHPYVPGARSVDWPRGGYGTLAADPPADRSSATTPPGHEAPGRRPDADPRPGDVPPDPAPGDQ
ncbi:MAG TPA: hypothetical protein VF323_03840 [Candidatus Limnocylindrales bacterium]